MQKIYFATSNDGKFKTMQHYVAEAGLGFEVEQIPMDLVEIQADSITEIAVAKAAEAQAQLQAPVFIDDSGLFIEALDGFPGPYSKYVEQTLGAKGVLKLLEGQENRRCVFHNVLVFADIDGSIYAFEDFDSITGRLAEKVDETPCDDVAWSDYWRIFIPDLGQHEKPLSAFSAEELEAYYAARSKVSAYANAMTFLKQNKKAA